MGFVSDESHEPRLRGIKLIRGMSAKISGTFLRAALGPIQYAAGLVSSNKVLQGIEELGAAGLLGGLKRGINEVGALVGVSASEIERAMPMAQVDEVARRLETSQPAAVAAWKLHAGPFGFMDVITALTIDGRKAEIGACLERVAKKVAADPELAKPLATLATDVTAWEEIIVRCRHILDDRDWLAKAYARKRTRRLLLALVPIAVIVASLSLIIFVKGGRDRVDKALSVADACAVSVAPSDMRFASRAQEHAITDSKTRCETTRAAKEKTRIEEEHRQEIERKAAAEKAAHAEACTKLASSVTDGSFTQASATSVVDAASAPLLERIATKKLDPADVGPTDPTLPCPDTEAPAAIESAFGKALVSDVTLWARKSDPSPFAQRALVAHKDELSTQALAGLAESAENSAKSGLTTGKPDVIAHAKRLCSLAHALAAPVRGSCNAVDKL